MALPTAAVEEPLAGHSLLWKKLRACYRWVCIRLGSCWVGLLDVYWHNVLCNVDHNRLRGTDRAIVRLLEMYYHDPDDDAAEMNKWSAAAIAWAETQNRHTSR